MDPAELEAMMQRHAAGDRDPDLLEALTRQAWSAFHDPWEHPGASPAAVPSLRIPLIDEDPCDPDAPEKLDVGTLDSFVRMHARSHLKRKSWPFFVTYEYLADPEPERCPRVLMESPDGRSLVCAFVRRLQCPDADLPEVHAFCQRWSDGQPRIVAKLVEAPGPEQGGAGVGSVLVLTLGVTLAEEHPTISLRDFDRMLHELLDAASVFWNQVRAAFEP